MHVFLSLERQEVYYYTLRGNVDRFITTSQRCLPVC